MSTTSASRAARDTHSSESTSRTTSGFDPNRSTYTDVDLIGYEAPRVSARSTGLPSWYRPHHYRYGSSDPAKRPVVND